MGTETCRVFALLGLPFQRDHQTIRAHMGPETRK